MTTRVITRSADGWPPALDEAGLPFDRLFVRGREVPSEEECVAVVGTRRPTAAGVEATRQLAKDLVQAGFTIVSGLALGIDAIAHRAALEAGGHTVAVLGCGCDLVYPKRNSTLKDQIEASGTVLSEYPDGTESAAWRFPERNRIIAGLCKGVVVVEGAYKSGALITARHALDFNREIFAVPGSIRNPMAVAPNELIRTRQADLVTDIKHITDVLAPSLVYARDGVSGPSRISLDEGELTVLTLLDDLPITTQFVRNHTGLSVGEAAVSLSRLEVRNFVRRSGAGYELTEAGARARSSVFAE